jgi:hypothetical protein
MLGQLNGPATTGTQVSVEPSNVKLAQLESVKLNVAACAGTP